MHIFADAGFDLLLTDAPFGESVLRIDVKQLKDNPWNI